MNRHDLLRLIARGDVYAGIFTTLTLLVLAAVLMWGTL